MLIVVLSQGAVVSEGQDGKSQPKKTTPGKIALIGAIATALATFNLATNSSEAPAQLVLILQYFALAGGLLALIGGLIMLAVART